MAKVNQNSFKEANELAREALEMAEREYSKEGMKLPGLHACYSMFILEETMWGVQKDC